MDIYKTEIFKTICGDMLVGNPITLVVRGVKVKEVSDQSGKSNKPHIYFEKTDRPLVLNITNSKKIAKSLGCETNAWRGAKIKLYAEEIKVKGEMVNAVRLTVVEKPPVLTTQEHQARLKNNGNLLHGDNISTIGEDTDADRFADGVIKNIPFYTSRPQVFMTLVALGMTYSDEIEELCLDALATEASHQTVLATEAKQQADAKAA